MQNTLSEIQNEIKKICVNRYQSPGDFTEFADTLMSLGVIRQTYDVLENNLNFYSKNIMLYSLPVSEIEELLDGTKFIIGNTLDEARVKRVIENFDENKLSVIEFHHELARAGIVYVSVFLNEKTIYYLGQDGKYYLEKY